MNICKLVNQVKYGTMSYEGLVRMVGKTRADHIINIAKKEV